MSEHHVVQARAAWLETFFFGVIFTSDQPHELAHDVSVIPRRSEGIFGDEPAVRENDKIHVGDPR